MTFLFQEFSSTPLIQRYSQVLSFTLSTHPDQINVTKKDIFYKNRDCVSQQQRFRDELLKREDQEDDRWLANRMAKLQQELREIDQLAPSARKGRLRKLQLELHPDKQPERLRAKCQKLFLIVQGRWEAHEATLQRETNQRNQDEERARAAREERQRRQRSQEERQRKHREEQEKAERERAEREAR